jgi:transposase
VERERRYPPDLTDEQWEIVEPMLPLIKSPGRIPKHPRRAMVDAILYVVRSGCSWRQLPIDCPPFLWSLICRVCSAMTDQLPPKG